MKFLPLLVAVAICLKSSVDAQKVPVKTPAQKACDIVPEGTYIADPASCKRFFKCEKGKPIPGSCSNSTSYSVVDNACIAKNAICVHDYVNIVCRKRKDGDKVADPENCKNYYTCLNQKATSDKPTACPVRNSFNAETQKCVPTDSYDCFTGGHCSLIADLIFTADMRKDKCFAYYLCMNNIPIAGKCQPGFGYRYQQGVCDFGYDCPQMECVVNKNTPIYGTCSQYHYCKKMEINPPQTCPLKKHFNAASAVCVDAYSMDQPCEYDRCENMPDGFYIAAPNTQCEKYLYCLKGRESGSPPSSCRTQYPDYPYLDEEYQQCVKTKPKWAICE